MAVWRRWWGGGLLLAMATMLAGCGVPPPGSGPADIVIFDGAVPVGPFTVLAGVRGPPEAIAALGASDPATMPLHRVGSIEEEYEILARDGLRPLTQALVVDGAGRYYDIIDTPSGPVIFDINSFYP